MMEYCDFCGEEIYSGLYLPYCSMDCKELSDNHAEAMDREPFEDSILEGQELEQFEAADEHFGYYGEVEAYEEPECPW